MPPKTSSLRVEHVTNSLAQIESWVNAVRTALAGFAPETPLPVPAGRVAVLGAAIRVQKDCPPPERKRRRKAKSKRSKK